MTGDIDDSRATDEIDTDLTDDNSDVTDLTDDDSDEEIDLISDDDDDGESTEEINVDALVAKIDATDAEEAARKREIRLKLEALRDQRDDEFGSTYNFDLDEKF